MTPEQAYKLHKRNLSLKLIEIAEKLIFHLDKILITEIESLFLGKTQEFSMIAFADHHLKNNDKHLFEENRIIIVHDIVNHYKCHGWIAEVLIDTDLVISIRTTKK